MAELERLRSAAGAAQGDGDLRANAAHFDEQKRLLLEAQDVLRQQFEAAGARVLEQAQDQFLKRAQERFSESEKTSAQRLNTLLAPVSERLKAYEEQVATLEAKRVDAFGQLAGLIEGMRVGQEQVRAEARVWATRCAMPQGARSLGRAAAA
jgi:DNA recombination protein RmuC